MPLPLRHFIANLEDVGHHDEVAVDWDLELASNSSGESHDNTRGPQKFHESLGSGLKKMRQSIAFPGKNTSANRKRFSVL